MQRNVSWQPQTRQEEKPHLQLEETHVVRASVVSCNESSCGRCPVVAITAAPPLTSQAAGKVQEESDGAGRAECAQNQAQAHPIHGTGPRLDVQPQRGLPKKLHQAIWGRSIHTGGVAVGSIQSFRTNHTTYCRLPDSLNWPHRSCRTKMAAAPQIAVHLAMLLKSGQSN